MFYGWRIVAISAVAQALAVGTTFYSYGVFVKPLAAEFAAPRLVVVLGLTFLMLVQGLVSPALGRALDVRSVRAVMVTGVLLCALGFLGLASATALWQVGLLFGSLIAVGSHMFGPLATATLVANWFVRDRGRALGLTAVGASVGGLVFPVVAAQLMTETGWRGAAAVFCGALMAFALPVWWIVESRPESLGLRPDGDPTKLSGVGPTGPSLSSPPNEGVGEGTSEREGDRQPPVPSGPRALLGSRNFWMITAAVGLAFCPVSVLLAHLVPYATDLGFEPRQAAFLMSAYAGAGAVGRLLIGLAADRIDKRIAAWIVFGVLIAAWICLVLAPSYPALLAASIGMGIGVGGIMPLWGALTGACFGRAVFGRAMGLMNSMMLPFNLAGAPIAAYVFDRTGSYTLVLSAFLASLALGALAITLLRIPRVEPGQTA